jgi:hypothetical protein
MSIVPNQSVMYAFRYTSGRRMNWYAPERPPKAPAKGANIMLATDPIAIAMNAKNLDAPNWRRLKDHM